MLHFKIVPHLQASAVLCQAYQKEHLLRIDKRLFWVVTRVKDCSGDCRLILHLLKTNLLDLPIRIAFATPLECLLSSLFVAFCCVGDLSGGIQFKVQEACKRVQRTVRSKPAPSR